MATQWDYYGEALKAKAALEDTPPCKVDYAESGRYFLKSRKGEMPPYRRAVALWRDAKHGFVMLINGKRVNDRGEPYTEEYASKIWQYIAENVVTKEVYENALATGEWWDKLPLEPQVKHGSNLPDDPFERLKVELDDKVKSTENWLVQRDKITSKEEADTAANLNKELLSYIKQADALFEEEKAPHWEKSKEIDARYAFRKTVKQLADRTRDLMEAFMKAEKRRLDAERDRVWRQQEAERIAREAVARQLREKQLRDDPVAAMTEPEPEPIAPIAPPPPVKVQAGGGFGSARGLKSVWTYRWPKEGAEEAYDKALLYYRRHPKIEEALEAILKAEVKSLKASCRTPGIEVYEDHAIA
jgi:hypothetical protein